MKNIKKIISSIILIAGLLLVGVAAYNIFIIQKDYNDSNSTYDSLEDRFVKVNFTGQAGNDGEPWYTRFEIDLSGIISENKDTVGWLAFENEELSYPVMYSGDDEKYLRTTFEGNRATAGSIFLEGNNSPDFQDSHSIIYGHNMKNLSMFGKLKLYNRDENYYDEHQYFQIFTEDAIYRYQIFAYETVSDDSFVYKTNYVVDEDFQDFITKIRNTSMRVTDIPVEKNDKVITLSTCSSAGDEYRFVVHGVRVDTYELKGEE